MKQSTRIIYFFSVLIATQALGLPAGLAAAVIGSIVCERVKKRWKK